MGPWSFEPFLGKEPHITNERELLIWEIEAQSHRFQKHFLNFFPSSKILIVKQEGVA